MDKRYYDAIIVGAGNGGLVAAATLAKAGKKVILFEKHNIPGGCATSFVRGRFEFEPSLHELCGIGKEDSKGTIYNILENLELEPDWQYENGLFRALVKGEDGYDLRMSAGVDGFLDGVEAAVPGCRDKVKKIFDLNDVCNEAQDYVNNCKHNLYPIKVALKYSDFMRMACHSMEEIMDALEIPKKAQNIVATYWCYLGLPTDEINALHYASMLNGYVREGAAMPHHRSHALSLGLCETINKYGGEIRFNSEVTELLLDKSGRVNGVVANGEKVFAKEIISNVIPNNIIEMAPEGTFSARDRKLANARSLGMTFYTIYLGLDKSAEELGIEDYSVFIMNDQDPRKQFEDLDNGGLYVVNCLNKAIPDASPEGTSMLFFTIPTFGDRLPEDLTPENYKKFKNDIAAKYIKKYEEDLGIVISPYIEEISVATPVTFARYLNTPDGEIYGYETTYWDNVVVRTTNKPKENIVPGLTFCGGHQELGDGFSSAYNTGERAAQIVLKKLNGGK